MPMRIGSNNPERYPMRRMLVAATVLMISTAAVLISHGTSPDAVGGRPAQSRLSPQVHWANRSVIQVWIDRENLPTRGDQLVERAMQTWGTASDGAFTLRRTFVERDAGIRVYFNGAGGNYGETRPRVNRATGLIDEAEVAIAADAPIQVDPLTRDIIVYLTALHELGHALGLEHTANFDDIMYLFREPGDGPRYFGNYRRLLRTADDIGTAIATGLSTYDLAALHGLYNGK
jgi:Matrixin